MGPFFIFADYPLKDKPAAEYHLTDKGCRRPDGIFHYLFRYRAFEKLNY
jgi:hypothetical protein